MDALEKCLNYSHPLYTVNERFARGVFKTMMQCNSGKFGFIAA
jgi:hypothetical protein